MRFAIAAILICAIGAPAALALPATSAKQPSGLKKSVEQVAKKSRPAPQRQSRGGAGGIHPLVGSGDY